MNPSASRPAALDRSRPAARPSRTRAPVVLSDDADAFELAADVLIVGGGPAATWSAIATAETGVSVILVDKGYCGASGVAATAGVGHWLVPPEPVAERDREIDVRESAGGFLTDRRWTNAVLDEAWTRTELLDGWGYDRAGREAAAKTASARAFASLRAGPPPRRSFMGRAPDYLRFLRGMVKRSGVMVLDHSPALELVRDGDGTTSGAQGYQRQQGRPWSVTAGAVILATGGTTWKSHSLGGDVNTGDGQLMAAEVGAHLSSMEFSNFYGMVPFGTSMDKNGFFIQASYWDHHGRPLEYENLHVSRAELLAASLQGTIHAQFTQFPAELQPSVRLAMPNFFMVTDKLGVDPFNEPFPMDWVQEGTVRGTGGVHVLDRQASTGVPGLYAAGDVAARDRVVGAATGAGGPNLAWAIASGTWAGRAAAAFAAGRTRRQRAAHLEPTGSIGLVPRTGTRTPTPWRDVVDDIRSEMLPIEKNAFRHDSGMRQSLTVLDRLWDQSSETLVGEGAEAIRAREAASMLAMARWANRSALARTESRGMHTRTDHPETDPEQTHRLLSGGLDEIWVHPDPELPVTGGSVALEVAAS